MPITYDQQEEHKMDAFGNIIVEQPEEVKVEPVVEAKEVKEEPVKKVRKLFKRK